MKTTCTKLSVLILTLVMMLTMFTACGKETAQQPSYDEIVDAAVQAALDAAAAPVTVTIEVDGKKITVEDADGKSVQQLLAEADITLKEGDILSIPTYQIISGDVTIQVLRKSTVIVVVAADDPLKDVQHTVVLFEGTVADAIAAAGIELAEDNVVNHELDAVIEDGMEIIISVEEEEPEETEPPRTTSSSSSSSSKTSSSSSSSSSGSSSSSRPSSTPAATTPPATTQPAPPPTTKPAKTVVSVEVYEDCDGSGHGVKVITYSDGTQEEVAF